MDENERAYLGDEVADVVTGSIGIVIACCAYLDGSVSVQVQPRNFHDGKPSEALWMTINRAKVLQKDPLKLASPEAEAPARAD